MKREDLSSPLPKEEQKELRKIAEKLNTNDVIVRYCQKHQRWEWFDPVSSGWHGTFPGEFSKEEVQKMLEKLYFCPMCDGIHAGFHFID
ncbi:hypothetical protein [Thermofilum sp.]|uniref:hypothetical protein n=1 Tax=Thermofilum sp. TaxID=1961369 RepID=UPI00316A7847